MKRLAFIIPGLFLISAVCGFPEKLSVDMQRESSARAGSPRTAMALVPAGNFNMGITSEQIPELERMFKVSHADLLHSAVPRHKVHVSSFYMDRLLVTNADYKRFVDANPKWRKDNAASSLHNGSYLKDWSHSAYPDGQENHPVVNVSWYAAVAYCQWSGKRLPTEAEWEYAAKGDLSDPLFPWGNAWPDKSRANFAAAAIGKTTVVTSYPPNGYAIFDMAGNVWQYLADEWAPYPDTEQKDPVAGGKLFAAGDDYLAVSSRRVIRGGSFGGAPVNLWVEYRDSHPPEGAREFVGFRCAKSASEH